MRVALLGLGMIGGSIARSLRHHAPDWHLVGYSEPDADAKAALAAGVVHEVRADPAQAVAEADLAIVAVPPADTLAVVLRALRANDRVIVTDVASLKGELVRSVVAKDMELTSRWVPGHPIAGREGSGFASSLEGLFASASWILTPRGVESEEAITLVRDLIARFGSRLTEMPPDEHDRLLAHTSHLPHLLAWALLDVAQRRNPGIDLRIGTGGGLRDVIRIANSNPHLWADIMHNNRCAIQDGIQSLREYLDEASAALGTSDTKALQELLECGREVATQLRPSDQEAAQ